MDQTIFVRWPRGAAHTRVVGIPQVGGPARWTPDMVYVGMPGKAAQSAGITGVEIGPFGKPWACLRDPRGWRYAYAVYLKTRLRDDAAFRDAVRRLHGKTLVCWCKGKRGEPDPDCHADLLAHEAERLHHEADA